MQGNDFGSKRKTKCVGDNAACVGCGGKASPCPWFAEPVGQGGERKGDAPPG